MSQMMPLFMMILVGGGVYLAWKNGMFDGGGEVLAEDITTETTKTCEEGTKCSCSICCGGKGCKGGKDNAKRTGATMPSGACECKCDDGCGGGSGSSGKKKSTVSDKDVKGKRKRVYDGPGQQAFKSKSKTPVPAKPVNRSNNLRPPLFGGKLASERDDGYDYSPAYLGVDSLDFAPSMSYDY